MKRNCKWMGYSSEVLVMEMNSGAPDKTCFFSFAFLARKVNRSKTTLMEYCYAMLCYAKLSHFSRV